MHQSRHKKHAGEARGPASAGLRTEGASGPVARPKIRLGNIVRSMSLHAKIDVRTAQTHRRFAAKRLIDDGPRRSPQGRTSALLKAPLPECCSRGHGREALVPGARHARIRATSGPEGTRPLADFAYPQANEGPPSKDSGPSEQHRCAPSLGGTGAYASRNSSGRPTSFAVSRQTISTWRHPISRSGIR